jgi:hypothetical protein
MGEAPAVPASESAAAAAIAATVKVSLRAVIVSSLRSVDTTTRAEAIPYGPSDDDVGEPTSSS